MDTIDSEWAVKEWIKANHKWLNWWMTANEWTDQKPVNILTKALRRNIPRLPQHQ